MEVAERLYKGDNLSKFLLGLRLDRIKKIVNLASWSKICNTLLFLQYEFLFYSQTIMGTLGQSYCGEFRATDWNLLV